MSTTISSTDFECMMAEDTTYASCNNSYLRADHCIAYASIIQESLLFYPINQYTVPKAPYKPNPSPQRLSSPLPSNLYTSYSYLSIPPSLPISPYLFRVLHYYRTSSPSHASRTVSNPAGTLCQICTSPNQHGFFETKTWDVRQVLGEERVLCLYDMPRDSS